MVYCIPTPGRSFHPLNSPLTVSETEIRVPVRSPLRPPLFLPTCWEEGQHEREGGHEHAGEGVDDGQLLKDDSWRGEGREERHVAIADAVGVGEEEVGEAVLELAERREEWGRVGGGRKRGR